jgi:hypothetical protein
MLLPSYPFSYYTPPQTRTKKKVPESAHSGKMPGDPSFRFNNRANSQGFSFGIIKAQSLESVSYRSEVQG